MINKILKYPRFEGMNRLTFGTKGGVYVFTTNKFSLADSAMAMGANQTLLSGITFLESHQRYRSRMAGWLVAPARDIERNLLAPLCRGHGRHL